MTFGVRPDEPNTQYGYIELGEPHEKFSGVHSFQGSSKSRTNSAPASILTAGDLPGIQAFSCFKASAFLEEMRLYLPESLDDDIPVDELAAKGTGCSSAPSRTYSLKPRIFPSTTASWRRLIAGSSCRSTWAGPTWAPGRRCGKFHPATTTTTLYKVMSSRWTVGTR